MSKTYRRNNWDRKPKKYGQVFEKKNKWSPNHKKLKPQEYSEDSNVVDSTIDTVIENI